MERKKRERSVYIRKLGSTVTDGGDSKAISRSFHDPAGFFLWLDVLDGISMARQKPRQRERRRERERDRRRDTNRKLRNIERRS